MVASGEHARWIVDLLLDYLELEGVEHIFGVPGGPLTPLFEALRRRRSIEFVLARHEGGAAFMANANARTRRALGVCCVTSGPGATNALTGAAAAMRDSLPVLYVTAQVATKAFARGAIQESTTFATDVVEMYRATTKLSAMITSPHNADAIMRHALRTALTGRWGAVHLSIPADVARQPVPSGERASTSYRSQTGSVADPTSIAEAARVLATSKRPCIYAGHGVALAGAERELLAVAERLGAPVITSPKGKGTFPEDHPLSLGVFGLGGHASAHAFMGTHRALLVVGSSLNEWSSSAWDPSLRPSPEHALVQLDVDATEIGRNYPVDVALVGDARLTLAALNAELDGVALRAPITAPHRRSEIAPEITARAPVQESSVASSRVLHASVATAQVDAAFSDVEPALTAVALTPPQLVRTLRDAVPDDAMLFVDNGNSIMWAGHYWQARMPATYWIDLGFASMGSAAAGVVGGKLGRPRQVAVALVGDAAFMMNGVEVHTAVELGLNVIWVVINNAGHGMVGQGEQILLGRDLAFGHFQRPIDCAAMARALGAQGARVTSARELEAAIAIALRAPGPTVIDALVDTSVEPPTLRRRADSLARFFGARPASPTEPASVPLANRAHTRSDA